MNRHEARMFRSKIESAAESQSDEQALQSIELFHKWRAGISVIAGERYQHNGMLYRVIQPHTTQEGWTPDITPALWVVVSLEEWPLWIQPLGAQDAYALGAHVSHNDKHWESEIPANTYEPGIYGWSEV